MLVELLEGQPARKKQRISPSVPISTLMLDGQRALDEKRYRDAVQHFSHAIENLSDRKADLLHVYDLRSSAYIKLNKQENALKDAKQMIRLDRADARGYLKCAQAEQSAGNLGGAAKVCEYGLKSVPASDKGHARIDACLIRVKELARKSVVLEKGTDPMEVLPSELLDMVVASFDYRQAVAVIRVSRGWRSRLRSLDIVTQTIDTRQSRRTLTYEQIKAAFTRLGKAPKSIALAKLNENAARLASSELSRWIRWQTLETLVIDDGKFHVTKLRYEKYTSLKNLSIGPGAESGLKVMEVLGSCHALQRATLHSGLAIHHTSQTWIVSHNLRSLSICPPQQTPLRLKVGYIPYVQVIEC